MLQIVKSGLDGNGTISGRGPHRRQRASARRHFRHGWRAAAAQAFTAAEIYLDKRVPSLAAAAMHCGSNQAQQQQPSRLKAPAW